MGVKASHITSNSTIDLTYPLFAKGIHQWPGNSRHKGASNAEKHPFDDVIMSYHSLGQCNSKTKQNHEHDYSIFFA